ncbi:hypothetical protein [Tautonia rosea]|uniref:hypothetical protein n=1 Tax=Tautonia rosea TaxID=2728037 RepID=UPI0014729DE4|nr:hypothetical protein [Tautonia rosea]
MLQDRRRELLHPPSANGDRYVGTNATDHDPSTLDRKHSWWTPFAVSALYLMAIVGATWPFARTFTTRLPSTADPLQHLWVMRWYKQCLMQGRSPLVCPDLQFPLGAPIGNFSPLHLQSLIYLILSAITDNDVLCFNLLWLFGFLLTGLGTFFLARSVLRDEAAAMLAGLLAMLSGPVLVHSHAHLELIYVGGFPIFFLAWMRLVERPGWGRLMAAVAGFILLAMCAAYFMVFAIFPAALYLGWKASRQPKQEVLGWLRVRGRWITGFVAVCLPFLMLLFAGQIWNVLNGQAGIRPRSEFDRYGAPWWAYLVPMPGQVLQGFFPIDVYGATRTPGEGMAYLGIVCLALLARAWWGKVQFRDAGFWWWSAAILVLLSLGSSVQYGPHRIAMPAGWLRDWEWFVPFRLIRVPARFKLFVPVCTGILAGAAWMQLRTRWTKPITRGLALSVVLLIAVVDLAQVPYGAEELPPMPGAYAWLREHYPDDAWVDIPHMNSGNAHSFNARLTYWQSLHGGQTTAGYSGHQNRPHDDLMSWNSPFADTRMMQATFPGPSGTEQFDLIRNADFHDYTWLYLTHHDLRFVVLHRASEFPTDQINRMAEVLDHARCYDDGSVVVFDRELMPKPRAPVALSSQNWGGYYLLPRDGFVRLATESSAIEFANPDPNEPLVFAFEARALGGPRTVTLKEGDRDLWSWNVVPGGFNLYVSPPFTLPESQGKFRLESDGALALSRVRKRFEGERSAVSMVVRGVCLRRANDEERLSQRVLAFGPTSSTPSRIQ